MLYILLYGGFVLKPLRRKQLIQFFVAEDSNCRAKRDDLQSFLARNQWYADEIQRLSGDELYHLIEEIPSDVDSYTSDHDCNSDPEDEVLDQDLPSSSALSSPHSVILERNYAESNQDDAEENPEDEWESDDDTILLDLVPNVDGNNNFIWRKKYYPVSKGTFHEVSGSNISDCEYPCEYFLQLFPKELIEKLVFETNLYATQKQTPQFSTTTVDEIKTFLGINIIMGIKKLPSYKDYWSSSPVLRDSYISSCMSSKRFSCLLGNLHVNDNILQPKKGERGFDKLYKIRPLLSTLSETFKNSYSSLEFQSIDESMIKFKGRSSIRQYMPNKPIKRGYKVWVRAGINGFIHEFQIYTGKIADITERSLGERVVIDLTRQLVGRNNQLYFDNFFSSVQLMNRLQEERIYACGTMRKNRKGFAHLTEVKQRGESVWKASKSGLVCLKWMDKKPILFISNFHNPQDVCNVTRRAKDGSPITVHCPTLVKNYNQFMGGVDKADMLKAIYELDRKSKKWWHRIFFHFLDVCVVNAYIIYKETAAYHSAACINLKEFKLSVGVGLIGAASSNAPHKGRKRSSTESKFKPYIPQEIRYDKVGHMPERTTSRRCANCSTRNVPHRSKWGCKTCKVSLCLSENRNCFALYHTSN